MGLGNKGALPEPVVICEGGNGRLRASFRMFLYGVGF